MSISQTTLLEGGACFTVETIENGFLLHVVESERDNFNILVRQLMNEAGPEFVVFPRSDGDGGYDCVHVMPHDPT